MTPLSRDKTPQGLAYTFMIASLSIGGLLFTYQGGMMALGGLHDSLWYLGAAEAILREGWMGPYDQMTLIRPPGYPLFLAINAWAGLPLHLIQHGLQIGASALLVLALGRWGMGYGARLLLFSALALHPVFLVLLRVVIAEALHVPAITALLAAYFGMLATARDPLGWRFFGWGVIAAGALATAWYTRAGALFLLPFLASATTWILLVSWRTWGPTSQTFLGHFLVLLLPPLLTLAAGTTIKAINARAYGVAVVHELAEPHFVSAVKWLARIKPRYRQRYVPVSFEAMEQAARVSPEFAPVVSTLTAFHRHGLGWSRFGCKLMGLCDELAGGWFLWALRDAVAAHGYYRDAPTAAGFYGKLAGDIRRACSQGVLACTHNPTATLLAPPLQLQDLPKILHSAGHLGGMLLALGTFSETVDRLNRQKAPESLITRYAAITHTEAGALPSRFLQRLAIATAVLQIMGIVLFSLRVFLRYIPNPWIPLMALLLLMISSRILMIAYIDAMSFPAILRYLIPAYPPLWALIALGLSWKAARGWKGSPGDGCPSRGPGRDHP